MQSTQINRRKENGKHERVFLALNIVVFAIYFWWYDIVEHVNSGLSAFSTSIDAWVEPLAVFGATILIISVLLALLFRGSLGAMSIMYGKETLLRNRSSFKGIWLSIIAIVILYRRIDFASPLSVDLIFLLIFFGFIYIFGSWFLSDSRKDQ